MSRTKLREIASGPQATVFEQGSAASLRLLLIRLLLMRGVTSTSCPDTHWSWDMNLWSWRLSVHIR